MMVCDVTEIHSSDRYTGAGSATNNMESLSRFSTILLVTSTDLYTRSVDSKDESEVN